MRFDPLWLTNLLKEEYVPEKDIFLKARSIREQHNFLADRFMLWEDASLLCEKFSDLGTYQGITVYDSRHAEEEFEKFFPNEDGITFRFLLSQGMKIIMRDFDYQQGQYVIISKSLGARIPIELRIDDKLLKHTGKIEIIGVVPTVRGPKEIHDKYAAIQLLVENKVDYGSVNMIPQEMGYFMVHVVENNIFAEFVDIVV